MLIIFLDLHRSFQFFHILILKCLYINKKVVVLNENFFWVIPESLRVWGIVANAQTENV